tara:strand:+ start:663 stop:884 length:222 start_codon:yes stop_codon:yes gene_type:complete
MAKKALSNFNAMLIIEGLEGEVSEDLYYAAWQHLIDHGMHLRLQGWYGRAAKTLIEEGLCREPRNKINSLTSS